MKKTKSKELKLHRETIRLMTPRELAKVGGGVPRPSFAHCDVADSAGDVGC